MKRACTAGPMRTPYGARGMSFPLKLPTNPSIEGKEENRQRRKADFRLCRCWELRNVLKWEAGEISGKADILTSPSTISCCCAAIFVGAIESFAAVRAGKMRGPLRTISEPSRERSGARGNIKESEGAVLPVLTANFSNKALSPGSARRKELTAAPGRFHPRHWSGGP
jgi:hypothetical protein